MNAILLIARRDLAAQFNSLWGYVVISLILVIEGLMFNGFALGRGAQLSAEVLGKFFYFSFGATCVATVLFTMRSFAEERQTGTSVLLDTAPIDEWHAVMGKYLAAMGVLGVLLVLSGYMPAMIFVNGKVSMGHVAAGYIGLVLAGSATTAMGIFASSLARSQLVAAVIAAALVVAFVTSWMLSKVTEPPFSSILAYASLYDRHFAAFRKGRIVSESLVYYVGLTGGFLTLATVANTLRRWR